MSNSLHDNHDTTTQFLDICTQFQASNAVQTSRFGALIPHGTSKTRLRSFLSRSLAKRKAQPQRRSACARSAGIVPKFHQES